MMGTWNLKKAVMNLRPCPGTWQKKGMKKGDGQEGTRKKKNGRILDGKIWDERELGEEKKIRRSEEERRCRSPVGSWQLAVGKRMQGMGYPGVKSCQL
jgi:hypothetical protein